jgi:transcriptional regulator with XRE-family HTH domain
MRLMRAGLTQTVLAERLGKPPSFVAKYELGERRLNVLEFLDIAAAVGFDPGELIGALERGARGPTAVGCLTAVHPRRSFNQKSRATRSYTREGPLVRQWSVAERA